MRMKRCVFCVTVISIVAIGRPVASGQNNFGALTGVQYVRPSSGFFPSSGVHVMQQMDTTGPSRGAEYCQKLWRSSGCVEYFRTPTVSKLITGAVVAVWSVTDTDFNLKWEFPLRRDGIGAKGTFLPYVTAGGGAIMLNGGTTFKENPRRRGSGLNGQGDVLAGMGFNWRWASNLGLKVDLTTPCLKQSGFSDVTYRSGYTCKVQGAVGVVHYSDAKRSGGRWAVFRAFF